METLRTLAGGVGLALALALLPAVALAVDPECESATAYDPASGPYLAPDNTIRFCAPVKDAQGDTLPEGYSMSCELTVEGAPAAFGVTQAAPGTYHELSVSETVKYGADAELRCLHPDAGAGEVVAFTARFRLGIPARPTLVPGS